MPLALSRTARALNSWAPNGEISVVGLNGTFKKDRLEPSVDLLPDPVYLPQKAAGPYGNGAPYTNGTAARKQERRRVKSAALQAIEMNLAPYRNGVVNHGFAEEPKPKIQDLQREPEPVRPPVHFVNGVAPISVQSQNNLNVRYGSAGSSKRRRFSSAGTPSRSVFPDASVQCGSALVLATGSQQSIGHLRKWNSQTLLGATSQDLAADPDLRVPERTALRRNASLPDLRLAEQLDATRLHRARPRDPPSYPEETAPLMRSPSDTGRALCFWVQEGEDQGVKTFHDLPAARRAKYEKKIALYRHQQAFQVYSIAPSGKFVRVASTLQAAGLEGQEELLNFSPRSLAQELTLLGRELLLAVEPAELLTYVMKPRMAEMETCPNLHRLLHFYERLAALVTSEILRGQTPSKRAQVLAMLIETAERCHALQNWQSCRALLSGIRSPPAVRLKDTWDQLRAEYPDHFSMFESLLLDSPQLDDSSSESEGGRPRPLAAIPYFGEIVARVRARPTVNRLRPARALWREPPSLAKWVDEQTSSPTECDRCQSRMHKNRACCYLVTLVLGKNFFCPIRRMPLEQPEPHVNHALHDSSADLAGEANVLQRLQLAQLFDDPDTLPFTSRLVQCCALQPGNMVHVRQRAEIVLRTAQATARAYDLEGNPSARRFWLHQTYDTMLGCMKRSIALEAMRPVVKAKQRFL